MFALLVGGGWFAARYFFNAQEQLLQNNAALTQEIRQLTEEVQTSRSVPTVLSPASTTVSQKPPGVSSLGAGRAQFVDSGIFSLTLGDQYVVYWVASSSMFTTYLSVMQREGITHPLAIVTSSTSASLGVTELPPLPPDEYYGAYSWDVGSTLDGVALGPGNGYQFVVSRESFEGAPDDTSAPFSLTE